MAWSARNKQTILTLSDALLAIEVTMGQSAIPQNRAISFLVASDVPRILRLNARDVDMFSYTRKDAGEELVSGPISNLQLILPGSDMDHHSRPQNMDHAVRCNPPCWWSKCNNASKTG